MDKPNPPLRVTPAASLEERDALTAELEQYQSKLIEMTDVCIQLRTERNQIASERDAHRDHLSIIAEMTGNDGDIGAAWEDVNALQEALKKIKNERDAVVVTLEEIGQMRPTDYEDRDDMLSALLRILGTSPPGRRYRVKAMALREYAKSLQPDNVNRGHLLREADRLDEVADIQNQQGGV